MRYSPRAGTFFETICTVEIGTGHNSDDFRASLDEMRCDVSSWASGMLDAIPEASPSNVGIVVTSSIDLELGKSATLEKIYEWALKTGLCLCHPEVGVQILLQHHDKLDSLFGPAELSNGIIIASEPIEYKKGVGLFQICKKQDAPPALYGVDGSNGYKQHASPRLIFVQE